MYRKLIIAVMAVGALSGMLWAEDASMEARVEKMGALRARLSVKLIDLGKLCDNSQNGVGVAQQELDSKVQQARTELNKRMQTENSRPAESRDQLLLDTLTVQGQKMDKAAVEWTQALLNFNRALANWTTVYQNLAQVYSTLPGDQYWLRAGLDPEIYTANLVAIDKRADETKAELTKSVTEVKKAIDQCLHQSVP